MLRLPETVRNVLVAGAERAECGRKCAAADRVRPSPLAFAAILVETRHPGDDALTSDGTACVCCTVCEGIDAWFQS